MIDENYMNHKLHGPEAKFYCNTAIPICFGTVCGCFQTTGAKLSCGSRDGKAEKIYSLALYGKSLPTPFLVFQ